MLDLNRRFEESIQLKNSVYKADNCRIDLYHGFERSQLSQITLGDECQLAYETFQKSQVDL
ncbi:MAG: hypothetical protein ABIJ65_12875 [Chloroflexota bacterium]